MPDLFVNQPKTSTSHTLTTAPSLHTPKKSDLKKVPLLSSFTLLPANLEFENQEPGELIHLLLRHHFITNLRWILSSFLGLFLPLIFLLISPLLESLTFEFPVNYTFILLIFYYLILLGYVFINFVSWYYNVGIITSIRVVDIDISHITSKNVAATSLADIVDVEYSQSGFMQNFFNYGNVHMQTEGLKANFEFLGVPKPAKATDVISDLMREAKK